MFLDFKFSLRLICLDLRLCFCGFLGSSGFFFGSLALRICFVGLGFGFLGDLFKLLVSTFCKILVILVGAFSLLGQLTELLVKPCISPIDLLLSSPSRVFCFLIGIVDPLLLGSLLLRLGISLAFLFLSSLNFIFVVL